MMKLTNISAIGISNMGWSCKESLESYKKVISDPDRAERLKVCECVFCYYQSVMTTQGYTSRECAICGETFSWGNGDTPNLCLPCAKTNKLCRYHICDLDFKERRKDVTKPKDLTKQGDK